MTAIELTAEKPRAWNMRAADLGPTDSDRQCCRCGEVLTGVARMLELDQRYDAYHDFGGVPETKSQGWFPFGLACARNERELARVKMSAA